MTFLWVGMTRLEIAIALRCSDGRELGSTIWLLVVVVNHALAGASFGLVLTGGVKVVSTF